MKNFIDYLKRYFNWPTVLLLSLGIAGTVLGFVDGNTDAGTWALAATVCAALGRVDVILADETKDKLQARIASLEEEIEALRQVPEHETQDMKTESPHESYSTPVDPGARRRPESYSDEDARRIQMELESAKDHMK
jgi:hypothetical protein